MDEILVHVTAPSSVRDDARYRAQVAAILSFQCASRHPISGTEADIRDHHSHQVSALDLLPKSPKSTIQHEASPIFREASRPAWEIFPDRHSVPEGERDNDLQNPGDHHIPGRDLDSLESLISVIPDSQPEIVAPDPDPDELFGSGPAFAEILSPLQAYPLSKRRCIQPQTHTQTQTLDVQDHVAQVHVSPAAESDITRRDSHSATDPPADIDIHPVQHVHVAIGDALNPILISSSIEESTCDESNDSPIPTSVMPLPKPLTLTSTTTTSTTTTTATPSTPTLPLHHPPTVNLTTLPLEIHAPQPPISTAPFTTHITPTLCMLTDRLRPERTYKPTHQTRDLDPLERGHWFIQFNIDSSQTQHPSTTSKEQEQEQEREREKQKEKEETWPSPSFHTFWTFLTDFISKDGRAGWGVWCILERSPPARGGGSTIPPNSGMTEPIDASVPVSLKVYAWGEVAMHIYLLLFLASERRIRGMGVQWRDAGEDVVIQMP
ncbi:hypothetical protein N7522_005104 [Penicillium canescens]|nr:hypothetical protein N7522_005104 [Penicillium canescens]